MRVPFIQLPRKLPLKTVAIVGGVGAAAAVAFAAFSWMPASASRAAASEPVARPARVMEIAYQQRSQSLVLAGTVVPRIESTLGFRVAGKIIARTVDVGTIVKPGDLIAQLDPADYRLAVDNARAALASADADYMRAKADHERYLNLRGTGAFTPQTLEQRQSLAATTLATRRAGQKPALLGREQPRLHRAARRRARRRHRRPGRGRPGHDAGPGRRAGRPHRRARNPGRRARAPAEGRAPGQGRAASNCGPTPAIAMPPRLRELSPSADPMTRTYPARFSVIDPPEFIGLGMTATLAFERPDAAPVAEVPLSAIFQRGTQPAVWVVDRQSGTVTLRPVTIARWRDDTAAIASGVKDGEMIATAGVHKLEAGQKVKPVQQAAR